MKRNRIALLLSVLLLFALSACGGDQAAQTDSGDDVLTIAATTYPVYLFTTAVTEGVEGVEVELVVNQQTSCLHDYTLTVNDMKVLERADVIVLNGAGLEDFMADALSASDATVIDCSQGLDLLPAAGHEGHDHDTEYDPHIWMDPTYVQGMLATIATGLSQLVYGDDWASHGEFHTGQLVAKDQLEQARQQWADQLASLSGAELITFHDGFQYFAQAFGLDLLKSIEEDEGSEASAADIKEIIGLIQQHDIPAIFTEVNGSDATANAIARETGVEVCTLDMIMSGEGRGIQPYLDAMQTNIDTIADALGGK